MGRVKKVKKGGDGGEGLGACRRVTVRVHIPAPRCTTVPFDLVTSTGWRGFRREEGVAKIEMGGEG